MDSRDKPAGSREAAWLSGLAAALAASVTGLLIFETVTLAKGRRPITGYVRRAEDGHPRAVAVGLSLAALLIGHFEWH